VRKTVSILLASLAGLFIGFGVARAPPRRILLIPPQASRHHTRPDGFRHPSVILEGTINIGRMLTSMPVPF